MKAAIALWRDDEPPLFLRTCCHANSSYSNLSNRSSFTRPSPPRGLSNGILRVRLGKRVALVTYPGRPAEAGMWLLLTLPHEAPSCLGAWSLTGAEVRDQGHWCTGGGGWRGEETPLPPSDPPTLSNESHGSVFRCSGRNARAEKWSSGYILSLRSTRLTKQCLNRIHTIQCTFYPLAFGYLQSVAFIIMFFIYDDGSAPTWHVRQCGVVHGAFVSLHSVWLRQRQRHSITPN